METSSIRIKQEAISSLESTIRKSEKALTKLTAQGSNITLIRKRLKAFRVGLAALNTIWSQSPLVYRREELIEAHLVLSGMVPAFKSTYSNLVEGSAQQTLLKRRIMTQALALLTIEELIRDNK